MGNACCGDGLRSAHTRNVVAGVNYAFFDALPSGVQEVTVDHVYDGDTLTIRERDCARVRLLGVDTPELRAKEPYAKESAAYVKELCPPGTKIWLRAHQREPTDHYNRLLSCVFVANPAANQPGYICVNISLLQQGLATFYEPSGTVEYREEMLKAEQVAISRRLNIWKKAKLHKVVYTTPNGVAFHKSDCLTLQKAKTTNLLKQPMSEALQKGASPCRKCKPL
ncbi:hypothetical protein ABL78_5570 [Leptomonas seymouri]|uniref:TNase-like domain-containing protein n=1 Tax=Leptomonas seymouri TaxID=5684 RepID=A0A0N0P4K0_LEPSE|nr:hypothetical protein ABL78_5570 [Leptomonas seymouri]|eukprot:KPI85389.1 hypothetical protein ABL78_5570 [Leptomonas seymouri]